jgi:hypothetical protein
MARSLAPFTLRASSVVDTVADRIRRLRMKRG